MSSPQPENEMKEDDVDMEDEDGEDIEAKMEGDEDVSLIKAKQAITCRNVTLNTLMEDGMIQAGEGVLSIDYLGQRFEADLLESGKIKWHGSQEVFGTPSAWALHCKRLVNPIKRSGCGWASVKYNNKKLDIWKSIWARKHRPSTQSESSDSLPQKLQLIVRPPAAFSTNPSGEKSTPEADELTKETPPPTLSSDNNDAVNSVTNTPTKESTEKVVGQQAGLRTDDKDGNKTSLSSLQQILVADPLKIPASDKPKTASTTEASPLNLTGVSPGHVVMEANSRKKPSPSCHGRGKTRQSISYSALGTRTLDIDPHTLIKCEKFDNHSKLQPFTVSVNSNALLLMDFHCYLTRSEVVGYLGGRWDTQKQHLSVEQVFPVCCRLGDVERAPLVEDEIRRSMRAKHMTLVGWYHSHPYCQSDPSLHDVDCQMSYQLKMRGSGSMYQPCLAFVVSPFEYKPSTLESQIQAFWVMPNLEHPAAFNIPMHVTFSTQRDSSLTEDILSDMKHLSEYYGGHHDKLILREQWRETVTYVDKIRGSIKGKLPEDQLDSGTFLDYMQQLLRDMK